MERITGEIWRVTGQVDLPKQTPEEIEKLRQEIIAQSRAEGLI